MPSLFRSAALFLTFVSCSAFLHRRGDAGTRLPSLRSFEAAAEPPRKSNPFVLEKIDKMVHAAPIVLFMKGTPLFPQCGFSGTAVQILDRMNIKYNAHDITADDSIRQGIKDYSQWPTIPQLFIDGEFIGGSDIIYELYLSGELSEMIEVSLASQ